MRPRVIPLLLLDKHHRLVKTRRFSERVYIGDPFNVMRIFNEKEVDEICVVDIDASLEGRGPDIGFARELAAECFMPLAYGGGLETVEQCEKLMKSGVEKFVIGSAAKNSSLIRDAAREFGSQSVVVCIDVIKNTLGYSVVTHGGSRVISSNPVEFAKQMALEGAGEILLQSVDRDGSREGYDLQLTRNIVQSVSIPVVAAGGAGSVRHLQEGLTLGGASAVASGSAFVFIGRLRGVLISYPAIEELVAAAPPVSEN